MIWGSGSFLTVCLTQRLDQVENWYSPPPHPNPKEEAKSATQSKGRSFVPGPGSHAELIKCVPRAQFQAKTYQPAARRS